MSLENYEIKHYSCNGNYIQTLAGVTSLNYGRKKNDIGIMECEIPGSINDYDSFGRDDIFEIYRFNPQSGRSMLQGNTCWFLQGAKLVVDNNCSETITLTAEDTITLLNRRVVAWTEVQDPNYPSAMLERLDDILTLLVYYNFGGGTTSPTFANASILGFAPSGIFSPVPPIASWQFIPYGVSVGGLINRQFSALDIQIPQSASSIFGTHKFATENVLSAMQDVASNSALQGESLWFDIEYAPATPSTNSTFIFRTWVGVRGTDRSVGINQITVGPQFGNVYDTEIVRDWTDYANVAYVSGDGDADLTSYAGVRSDSGLCLFNDREVFESESNAGEAGVNQTPDLVSAGQNLLAQHRPQVSMTGKILNQAPTRFDTDIFYGDLLLAKYKGFEEVVEISEYSVSISQQSEEIEIPFATI